MHRWLLRKTERTVKGTEGYGYFNVHHYYVNIYVAINRLVAIKFHLPID